jgi:hypothetical protein
MFLVFQLHQMGRCVGAIGTDAVFRDQTLSPEFAGATAPLMPANIRATECAGRIERTHGRGWLVSRQRTGIIFDNPLSRQYVYALT